MEKILGIQSPSIQIAALVAVLVQCGPHTLQKFY
jgi:hypothetical protein